MDLVLTDGGGVSLFDIGLMREKQTQSPARARELGDQLHQGETQPPFQHNPKLLVRGTQKPALQVLRTNANAHVKNLLAKLTQGWRKTAHFTIFKL